MRVSRARTGAMVVRSCPEANHPATSTIRSALPTTRKQVRPGAVAASTGRMTEFGTVLPVVKFTFDTVGGAVAADAHGYTDT